MSVVRRSRWLPLLLLLLTALSAAAYFDYVRDQNRSHAERSAGMLADRAAHRTEQALHSLESGLRGARGAVMAVGGESARWDSFQRYAASRELAREYPGARGFGFIRRVPIHELDRYLARQRGEGRPDFSISRLADDSAEHAIVEFVEPLVSNRAALGVDMASERVRLEATTRATLRGQPTLSAPLTIMEARDAPGRGLLLLLPVWRPGLPATTPAERDAATFGWIYAPLLIDEVLQSIYWRDDYFHLALSDITDPAHPQRFYGHADEDTGHRHPFKLQRRLDLFGRTWGLEIAPTAAFMASLNPRNPWRDAVSFAVAGAMLSLALHFFLRHRERLNADRISKSLLAAIVRSSDSAIIGRDLQGRVTSWNRAAEGLFGYAAHEAIGRDLSALILPEGVSDAEDLTRTVVQTGRSVMRLQTRRRHCSGALLEVEISDSPIHDGEIAVVGISSTIRDLTRQHAMERTFRELTRLGSVHMGTDFIDRASEALRGLIGADWLFVARVSDGPDGRELRMISAWGAAGKESNQTVPLAGTPCEVLYNPAVRLPGDLALPDGCELIPNGADLRFQPLNGSGYQGFIGFPLRDRHQNTVGHIAAFFRMPLPASEHNPLQAVGWLFAHRVEAELMRIDLEEQRNRVMDELRALNVSLEGEVASRTGEIRRVSVLQKAILDNAGYAVIAADAAGRINLFNPAAERMLGYRKEEVLGEAATRFHDPIEIERRAAELSSELGEPVTSAFETFVAKARVGQRDEREWTFLRKDGQRLPVLLNVRTLLDEGGAILGYLGIAIDLSERKHLELALTSERDRFRTILDLAPGAILIVNARGIVEKANERSAQVFGYRRGQIEGQPIEMLIGMSDRGAHVGQRERYLSEGANARLMSGRAVAARHRDGHRIPMEVRLSRFGDADGIKVIAIATDRSEQLLLAESEERWRTMANVIPHLVWMLGPDGSVDFVSQQTLEYTGTAAIAGWDWGEAVHADDYHRVQSTLRDGAANGTHIDFEYRNRRHDGAYRWFHARAVPLRDERGKIIKWIGTSTDIDDRKQAEQQVRDINATLERRIDERTHALDIARRDLQNILDALPSVVGYWDRSQRNRFANHAVQRWFGIATDDMPGRSLADILGPKRYEMNRPHVEAVLRGESQNFERQDSDARGIVCYSQIQYIPNIVDGEVKGFYALIHDISEVRRAQAAAEAASAAKSIFLANMSHEIRTPLNAVLGMLELLRRSPLDSDQRGHVDKAGAAARTLLGILNDILDFSKIEAGKMSLDPQPFELDVLMRELGVMLATSRGEKPIELIFDIGADVPRRLVGDALRLKQVLINLAGNALKFTERGEVVLSVQVVRVDPQRAELSFAVRDTGIGMSADQCRRAFDSFMQGEASTTRRYGGTGLGLAISQRLTLLMGGELYVYSAPGAGSTFRFSLPFGRPAAAVRPAPAFALRGLRTLLVEDHATARDVLSGVMRGFGWTVDAYPDCETLADALGKDAHHDVVVLDWPPPSAACESALSRMQDQAHTVLIGLAADLRLARADSVPGSSLRPAAVLPKPVTASQLLDAIVQARMRGHSGILPPADTSASAPAALRRLDGLRILVVEDNPTNQIVAQGLLSAEGACVSLAGGGVSGLAAVRQAAQPFDVVLMDVQMPDMDGYEVTRRIRELPQGARLPIIAMTANALSSDREDCRRAGMNEHVAKPFELARLVEVILACLAPGTTPGRGTADADAGGEDAEQDRPVLDLEHALSRMGGDVGTYHEVLRSALGDLPRLHAGVRDPATDPALRLGQIHTLKGLAATVGADRLRGLAMQAERMFKHGAHPAWAQDHAAAFDACFADSVRELQAVLEKPGDATERRPIAAGPLPPRLRALEHLLAANSGDALALFEELRRSCDVTDVEAFASLGAAINALDFAQAEQICRAMLDAAHAEVEC